MILELNRFGPQIHLWARICVRIRRFAFASPKKLVKNVPPKRDLWREIVARGRRPAARRRRPRLEGWFKRRLRRRRSSRNEYHRNPLRDIAKPWAIWSSGSKRANRADSGASQQTMGTPRASAGGVPICRTSSLRGASSTAGLRPSRRRWLQGEMA